MHHLGTFLISSANFYLTFRYWPHENTGLFPERRIQSAFFLFRYISLQKLVELSAGSSCSTPPDRFPLYEYFKLVRLYLLCAIFYSIVPSTKGALLFPLPTRICRIYFNNVSSYITSVQRLDCLICFRVVWHFNESVSLYST